VRRRGDTFSVASYRSYNDICEHVDSGVDISMELLRERNISIDTTGIGTCTPRPGIISIGPHIKSVYPGVHRSCPCNMALALITRQTVPNLNFRRAARYLGWLCRTGTPIGNAWRADTFEIDDDPFIVPNPESGTIVYTGRNSGVKTYRLSDLSRSVNMASLVYFRCAPLFTCQMVDDEYSVKRASSYSRGADVTLFDEPIFHYCYTPSMAGKCHLEYRTDYHPNPLFDPFDEDSAIPSHPIADGWFRVDEFGLDLIGIPNGDFSGVYVTGVNPLYILPVKLDDWFKPYSFQDWVMSYDDIPKRERLIRTYEKLHTSGLLTVPERMDRTHSTFTKREDLIKGFEVVGDSLDENELTTDRVSAANVYDTVDGHVADKKYRWTPSDPRVINGMDLSVQVIEGPHIKAMSKFVAKVWLNGQDLGSGQQITYSCGMTSEELGEWFDNACGRFSVPIFIENDFSRYDSTISTFLLSLERYYYHKLGMEREIINSLTHQDRLVGRNYTMGMRYSMRGTRASGDNNTSVGNSIINAFVHAALLRSMGVNKYSMIVMGDDNLIITDQRSLDDARSELTSRNPNITLEDYIPAFMAAYGLKSNALLKTNPMHVEFCSGRFWPIQSDVLRETVFGPKIGRIMSKAFWALTPMPRGVSRAAFARSIAIGLVNSTNHIPVVRALVRRVLGLTEGCRGRSRDPYIRAAHKHECGANEIEDLVEYLRSKGIGVWQADIARIEQNIMALESLDVAICDPLVNQIVSLDL